MRASSATGPCSQAPPHCSYARWHGHPVCRNYCRCLWKYHPLESMLYCLQANIRVFRSRPAHILYFIFQYVGCCDKSMTHTGKPTVSTPYVIHQLNVSASSCYLRFSASVFFNKLLNSSWRYHQFLVLDRIYKQTYSLRGRVTMKPSHPTQNQSVDVRCCSDEAEQRALAPRFDCTLKTCFSSH